VYLISFLTFLDQSSIPKEKDLIINSDGRFFKVMQYNNSTKIVKCSLVAVSGGGNGGGGGGIGPDNKSQNIKLIIDSLYTTSLING
jgi:hypothetical protein